MKKLTTDEFIAKAILARGHKYDYSKVTYINAKTPVTVICKIHSEFDIIPNNHLSKSGCPKCAIETKSQMSRLTQEEFLERAISVHGDKHDYSKTVYTRHCDKITVICKIHGEFSVTANNHLKGVGCKKCSHEKLSIDKSFDIETLKKLKSDDNTAILSLSGKHHMIIDCKIHGKAKISKYGYGNKIICPKCSIRSRHENQKLDFDEFYNRYTKKYPDIKILFDRDSFRNMNEPMKVLYNGVESELTPNQLLHGGMLYYPGYAASKSKIELKLADRYPEFKSGDRSAIKPYELDLYSEKYNLAIEVNGVYWHSDKFKDRNYHLIKTLKCEKRGISLLHFWETELENNFDFAPSVDQDRRPKGIQRR